MKKNHGKVTFKAYHQGQAMLLPRVGELIPETHLVRVVNRMVWAKRNRRYQEDIREKVKEILEEIERVNEAENEKYGGEDLPEVGGGSTHSIQTVYIIKPMQGTQAVWKKS